ncbi:MAG: HepT-like ribonuclease domain-containing protein [Sphingomonas sp.]
MNDEGRFLADKRTQQAVILNRIIVGEVATKLMDRYPEISAAHPNIEWRGMRNRIAPGYYDINLEVVWETVATALPDLATQLDAIQH